MGIGGKKMAGFNVAVICTVFICCVSATHESFRPKKIVFFPVAMGNSPYFIFLRMAEELQARGHETSILTTKLLKKRESVVQQVEYAVNLTIEDVNKMKAQQSLKEKGFFALLNAIPMLLKIQTDCCESVLLDSAALKELRDADIIVSLSISPCSTFLAEYLNKPFVLQYPAGFNLMAGFAGVPLPPSYVPFLPTTDDMTFMQRTINFIAASVKGNALGILADYSFRGLKQKYNIKKSFSEVHAQAELHLVSLNFAVEFVHPLMPNVFYVGTILPKPAEKLPAKLEKIMQDSGDHGVLLISFGSEITALTDKTLSAIAEAVSDLKQTVIWKVKLPEHIKVGPNVKTLDWLPQNDLLGHKKLKAFVSHMGANGAYEAAYHGVPIVAACIWGDNFDNAQRFVHKAKMGKIIDVYNANSSEWQSTIEELIYNPSYKSNALRVSKLIRRHPRTGVQRSGDLIEYALANGGRLPHLKAHAFNLTWYQYYCIDVLAFLAFVVILVTFIFIKLVKFVFRCFSGASAKDKLKKN